MVQGVLLRVGDRDLVVQRQHLCAGEQRPRRHTETLQIVDICGLSGLTKAMMLGKSTHDVAPFYAEAIPPVFNIFSASSAAVAKP